MTNTAKRLILFLVAVPTIIALILFLPYFEYLAVIILLSAIGILCGIELRTMLMKVAPPLPIWSAVLPGVVPLLAWVINMGWLFPMSGTIALIIGVAWALADAAFAREAELKKGFVRISSRLLLVMYPGWLLWWMSRLTWFEDARFILLFFALTIFSNDSTAWLFGVCFGRKRKLFAVSPNKSLEGFIGGTLGSMIVVLCFSRFFPEIFTQPLWQLILFALLIAATTFLGDLAESALKRAVDIKDSGRIIFGRGGMLDSVDSLLYTAPFFVIFFQSAVS